MMRSWFVPGSYFVLSMMDRLWRPDLTEEEAVQLMEKGIEEVRDRLWFPVSSPSRPWLLQHERLGTENFAGLHLQGCKICCLLSPAKWHT